MDVLDVFPQIVGSPFEKCCEHCTVESGSVAGCFFSDPRTVTKWVLVLSMVNALRVLMAQDTTDLQNLIPLSFLFFSAMMAPLFWAANKFYDRHSDVVKLKIPENPQPPWLCCRVLHGACLCVSLLVIGFVIVIVVELQASNLR